MSNYKTSRVEIAEENLNRHIMKRGWFVTEDLMLKIFFNLRCQQVAYQNLWSLLIRKYGFVSRAKRVRKVYLEKLTVVTKVGLEQWLI